MSFSAPAISLMGVPLPLMTVMVIGEDYCSVSSSSGRMSINLSNPLSNDFRPGHRGTENDQTQFRFNFGKHMTLGKAHGLVGIKLIGANFSANEKKDHPIRLAIFEWLRFTAWTLMKS